MIELLSPVGDFECLKAAVQNGADAVYFGASSFSARAFATNFDNNLLEQAINYAKIRGVKTNLTLNTLIKNNEIAEAINLAKKAYEYGIDAIIVQDLGLARYLIKNFPDLHVHGSTQMSVHSLEGVLALQNLGFSRVVLSRELNINEIEYICKNSNIEIEVFVHGALCISYSGQCLFSSIVGGRSGNRGKCAQPCRLPYELLENNSVIDKGFLLSPRDLCGLDFLPQLVNAGVSCLKIEGRMKTPEYVATVTRIYRKYLDILQDAERKKTEPEQNCQKWSDDKKDLLQVFNRGGFSNGHLSSDCNRDLIYKYKPNNMGIYLGTISNFNNNRGYITFVTNDTVSVGDKISVENKKGKTSSYTISELMIGKNNIKNAVTGDKITIGRMKGNIFVGNKIYKISDKLLTTSALDTLNKENRKRNLNCKLIVKKDTPISFEVFDNNGLTVNMTSDIMPVEATNLPITEERLITQISKTNNTPFNFENIEIELDNNLYVPSISSINELRRTALSKYEEKLINGFKRNLKTLPNFSYSQISNCKKPKQIALLLNILNKDFDYSKLSNVDKIYVPLKYFLLEDYKNILNFLANHFDTYIYFPTIMRQSKYSTQNYFNRTNELNTNSDNPRITTQLQKILQKFNITGFVISNIGNLELLKDFTNYKFICNYTFNIYNNLTINELDIDTITLSPELNKFDLQNISSDANTEFIVYGRIPLMHSNYCLLGNSNKCYSSCDKKCMSSNKYFLKDRLGLLFRVIPDNSQTVTTIYNSKITSISPDEVPVDSVRIDILDESIDTINEIIVTVKSGNKFEGKDYTNGNFNREI